MSNLISIIMGSKSDWPIMEHAGQVLENLKVPFEARALSAHRTPDALFDYLRQAEENGVLVFIAAAGGAAHLPGVVAAKTRRPVIGVPMSSQAFNGMDSLLSIVQMPGGIPVATMAVGKPGAINAALYGASILGLKFPEYDAALKMYRQTQAEAVIESSILRG